MLYAVCSKLIVRFHVLECGILEPVVKSGKNTVQEKVASDKIYISIYFTRGLSGFDPKHVHKINKHKSQTQTVLQVLTKTRQY